VVQRVGRCIALLFHNHGTSWGEWSAAHPSHTLPSGRTRYPFYRRLGGPQGRSGWVKNLVSTRIRSWTVQPIVTILTELSSPQWYLRKTHNPVSSKGAKIGFMSSSEHHAQDVDLWCSCMSFVFVCPFR